MFRGSCSSVAQVVWMPLRMTLQSVQSLSSLVLCQSPWRGSPCRGVVGKSRTCRSKSDLFVCSRMLGRISFLSSFCRDPVYELVS